MRINLVRDSVLEKLQTTGTRHLSEVEILVCLAGDKAMNLLAEHGSLRALARLDDQEITRALGMRNGGRLLMALELGRRVEAPMLSRAPHLAGPEDVYRHVRPKLAHLTREEFWVIMLNARHRLMGERRVAEGGLASCAIMPRDVFEPAIRACAPAIVLVHNHPSGDPTPSREDVDLTKRLVDGAGVLGLSVVDHVVVGENGFASLSELGEL